MVKKPGRKKATNPAPPALAIRFSPELTAAVDKASEQIAKERPDMTITRSDAIRVLVDQSVKAFGGTRHRILPACWLGGTYERVRIKSI